MMLAQVIADDAHHRAPGLADGRDASAGLS
jgi:hypothetical protein